MKAYVFPGQGAQFVGMGMDLYDNHAVAKEMFEKANEILGFRITDLMFAGTDEDLRQTRVTQPAIFLHSVILAATLPDFEPDMVAGHSLGEFSALVTSKAMTFNDGLRLVYARAMAMQKACEAEPGTMAAILGLDDAKTEEVLSGIDEIVVPANYNSPGQLVISGSVKGIEIACEAMEPARIELAAAIEATVFSTPVCPVYQNVDAKAHTLPSEIKANLVAQLTSPVRWTQIVQNMVAAGATTFIELGPGSVLQGLVKKIAPEVETKGV